MCRKGVLGEWGCRVWDFGLNFCFFIDLFGLWIEVFYFEFSFRFSEMGLVTWVIRECYRRFVSSLAVCGYYFGFGFRVAFVYLFRFFFSFRIKIFVVVIFR